MAAREVSLVIIIIITLREYFLYIVLVNNIKLMFK